MILSNLFPNSITSQCQQAHSSPATAQRSLHPRTSIPSLVVTIAYTVAITISPSITSPSSAQHHLHPFSKTKVSSKQRTHRSHKNPPYLPSPTRDQTTYEIFPFISPLPVTRPPTSTPNPSSTPSTPIPTATGSFPLKKPSPLSLLAASQLPRALAVSPAFNSAEPSTCPSLGAPSQQTRPIQTHPPPPSQLRALRDPKPTRQRRPRLKLLHNCHPDTNEEDIEQHLSKKLSKDFKCKSP
ncbi:anti-sigma-I factor RsgI2-like [Penaeus indicus]|uniref:anti-sigma-I factor RsgI2-like n=1 Tax=Penaeus indicus TaxID=29960 RepID=UPI00300CEE19